MSFFASLKVSGSALRAERFRVDLASANLANANSTRSAEGGPYRRRDPVLQAIPLAGSFGSELDRAVRMVNVRRVAIDLRPPREVFNPSHPDADAQGIGCGTGVLAGDGGDAPRLADRHCGRRVSWQRDW